MTPPEPGRVLVLASYRSDASILGDMLARHGFAPHLCTEPNDLAAELADVPPPVVMTQESMTAPIIDLLRDHLAAQSSWSELPLIMLLERKQRISPVAARLRRDFPGAKMTFLQRPVRTVELVSAVQSAVAARNRQVDVRDHIELQQELQRELNHRVKNALANVMAIYHMTKRQSGDLATFAESFEGRLGALSRVHGALLVTNEDRELADIAELVLAPYRSSDNERITIQGSSVTLPATAGVTFALCLHELATNASKYGALSAAGGTVSVHWSWKSKGGGAVALLEWREQGGPPVVPPSRKGYGTGFISSAVKGSLRGSVSFNYAPEGLRCSITIPLAAVKSVGVAA